MRAIQVPMRQKSNYLTVAAYCSGNPNLIIGDSVEITIVARPHCGMHGTNHSLLPCRRGPITAIGPASRLGSDRWYKLLVMRITSSSIRRPSLQHLPLATATASLSVRPSPRLLEQDDVKPRWTTRHADLHVITNIAFISLQSLLNAAAANRDSLACK